MDTSRNIELVESFVGYMKECIRFFAEGRLTEDEIRYMAEYEVNRLDFENEWQMHKGLGCFAKRAVGEYLGRIEGA